MEKSIIEVEYKGWANINFCCRPTLKVNGTPIVSEIFGKKKFAFELEKTLALSQNILV